MAIGIDGERNDLANRLEQIGCRVNRIGRDSMKAGDFVPTESKSAKKRGRQVFVASGRTMAKRNEPYRYCIVESYYPDSTSGLHGPIHIRPVPGQEFPTHLHVECSKDLVNPRIHPVGTRFRLRVKLTDRQGGGEFLYSYFGWPVEIVERPG